MCECMYVLGFGNNSIAYIAIFYIAVIVSHDFGLPILLQWQTFILLQLNNSYNEKYHNI